MLVETQWSSSANGYEHNGLWEQFCSSQWDKN